MKPVQEMTDLEIQEAAHRAIIRELGAAGLARYIQSHSLGSGDYTQDRAAQLPEYSSTREMMDEIRGDVKRLRDAGEI